MPPSTVQSYNEVVLAQPAVMTVPAAGTAISVGAGIIYKWVTSFVIRVRSMGTASYISIGDRNAQEFRLIGVGQIYSWSGNPGEVSDISTVYVKSDTADSVIEIVYSFVPLTFNGNVNKALDQ